MRLFVDMDGTLAKWNNVAFEQLYEEGYYRNLEPNKRLLSDLKYILQKGSYDVYVLSAYLTDSQYALKEKKEWIKEHLPELPEEKQLFVPFGESKAEFFKKNNLTPITATDLLLDDYTKNLLDWKEWGGTGIKCLNGINHTHKTWNGEVYSLAEQFYTTSTGEHKVAKELMAIVEDIRYYPDEYAFVSTHPALRTKEIEHYSEFQSIISAYNTVEKVKDIVDEAMYEKHNIKTYEDFEKLFELAAQKYPSLDISRIETIEYFDDYIIDIETKDGVVSFKSDLVNGYDIGTFEIMDNRGTVCTLDYHDLCDVACMYLASVSEKKILCEDINAYHYSFNDNIEDAIARVSEDNNYEFAVDNQSATIYGNYSIYDIKLSSNNDISYNIAGTYDICPSKCRIYLQHLTDADIDIINKLDNMYGSEIQNDSLYEKITHNNTYLYEINKYIKENAYTYLDNIQSNIEQLPDDFDSINELYSGGLYNCDKLYCDAIENIMGINLDDLNNAKNMPDICDD